MELSQVAALVVAGILGLDALIHVYWLTGRTWPAKDTRTLSRLVLNAEVPFTPRVLVPLVVILAGGASVVLGRADLLGAVDGWLPAWIWTVGALAVAGGALLRGAAGVVWALGISASRDPLFYRLNLVAYTPLCFLLCAAAVTAATRS